MVHYNVAGVDGTSGTGKYVAANGVCTFTAQIVAKKETVSASSAGFGLTLPIPVPVGVRYVFSASLEGRDADNGIWTGEAPRQRLLPPPGPPGPTPRNQPADRLR